MEVERSMAAAVSGEAASRSAPLLSSRIQTRSIELVLAPIASQVSQLMILTKTRGSSPFPDLESSSLSVMDAVQHMVEVGRRITAEATDERLQEDLPVACAVAEGAGERLVKAAQTLVREPASGAAQLSLNSAAQGLLEGTIKVLLVWDEAEVRKIVSAAHWTLDRLGLVKVAKSMRSLVICFGGLSEAMALLLSLADKRQKDLTDHKRKEMVLSALSKLKLSLPPFSDVMKKYVRDPNNVATQNLRNIKANQVLSAIHDLISAVTPGDEAGMTATAQPDNMVTNIMEVHRKLAPDSRYFIGPDLDRHLDAIIQNSTAVAHVSRDQYSERILQLCSEVLELRRKLGENLAVVTELPNSMEARAEFDETAELLCERLCEIDRWVADAVVDQITEVFVEPSAPVNQLVQAAARSPTTSPGSSPEISPSSSPTHTSEHEESDAQLTRQVELFRRHSRRLSQVASHAAQSSADSQRVQLITDLAKQVDEATPKVVEAAVALKRAPPDDLMEAKIKLDSARKAWAEKVQQLTAATDDIIDPEDFLAVSEANIHQDMTQCRDAVRGKNWQLVRSLAHGVAAKARRVADIGKMAAEQAPEPWKKEAIASAVGKLEQAIPHVTTMGDEVIRDPSRSDIQDSFAQSLKEVLESIHTMQTALTAECPPPDQHTHHHSLATSTPLGNLLGAPQEPTMSPVPPSPPPLPSTLPPPEMRYIGSLKRKKKNRASITGEIVTADGSVQTPVKPTGDAQTQTPSISGHSMLHPTGDAHTQTPSISGHSMLHPTGDAHTQTPSVSDHSVQHEIHYPSTAMGSTSAALSLSLTPMASPPGNSSAETSTSSRRERSKQESPAHSKAAQMYPRPLQELVSVAREGEVDELQSHVNALQARAIRLTSIAETAANTVRHNPKLMKVLKTKASELNKLTPQVIGHAEEVARDPAGSRQLGDLQLSSHQWAGHVGQLIEATQKANYPWSKTAERLVSAAKKGEGLEAQKKHVSTQTAKMVDVAMVTVTAAETEEAIGTGSSDDSHDTEFLEQIKHVRVTASEIQKLTPQLLDAADVASGRGDTSATAEHLNLLSQEWATKAKVLMRGVDDVSLGLSGPADTLLLSARSGDPGLLSEQGKAITDLASSLGNIAQDALEGCEDRKKAKEVKTASERISAVSAELISCANRVAEEGGGGGEEASPRLLEDLHETLESTELLRRDWASQVHLITAHVDALTAKMSAPLDWLVDVALQASRTSGKAKQHLLERFEKKATFLTTQLDVVDSCFDDATAALEQREAAVDSAALSISFLRKLTPHAIGGCRSLTSEPGSAMLEHFNHLRRQWASKAQKLLHSLTKITTADMEPVLAAFTELIQHSKSGRSTPGHSAGGSTGVLYKSYSFEDIAEEEGTGNLVVRDPSKDRPDPHKRYSAADEAAEVSRQVIEASKRPTSMAVPLPSWYSGKEGGYTDSSKSIAVAAQSLQDVADEFQEEGNIIIKVAKKMSQQMWQMAEFSQGRGELQSKTQMINTAKAIAANGQEIVRFANLISEQCSDERMKANLQYCAELIPTLSTQLRILASVKASTPSDLSADVMLVKNAQNLMQAVIKTMKAAEAACMKGLKAPKDPAQKQAVDMAASWKHRLYYKRALEAFRAPRGDKGLRRLNRSHISTPSLVDVLQPKVTH